MAVAGSLDLPNLKRRTKQEQRVIGAMPSQYEWRKPGTDGMEWSRDVSEPAPAPPETNEPLPMSESDPHYLAARQWRATFSGSRGGAADNEGVAERAQAAVEMGSLSRSSDDDSDDEAFGVQAGPYKRTFSPPPADYYYAAGQQWGSLGSQSSGVSGLSGTEQYPEPRGPVAPPRVPSPPPRGHTPSPTAAASPSLPPTPQNHAVSHALQDTKSPSVERTVVD